MRSLLFPLMGLVLLAGCADPAATTNLDGASEVEEASPGQTWSNHTLEGIFTGVNGGSISFSPLALLGSGYGYDEFTVPANASTLNVTLRLMIAHPMQQVTLRLVDPECQVTNCNGYSVQSNGNRAHLSIADPLPGRWLFALFQTAPGVGATPYMVDVAVLAPA